MPVMEKTQTKKSIWASLKEVFWDCDEIGEEASIEGDTPEQTAELLRAQANADKRYATLNNTSNNTTKGGKGNSGKAVETVIIDPKVITSAAKMQSQKAATKTVEDRER